MEPVADANLLDQVVAELERLKARVRKLESRLTENGVAVSARDGKTRTMRLSSDGESVEVE